MSWWLVDRQLFYSPVTDSRDFGGTEMLVGAGVCYFPSGHLGFGKTLVSHALVKWFVLGQASLCTKCSGIISESLYPPSTYWKQERAFLWPSLQPSGWASGGQTHRSVGVSLGPGPLVFLTLKWVRTEPRTIQLQFFCLQARFPWSSLLLVFYSHACASLSHLSLYLGGQWFPTLHLLDVRRVVDF